MSEENEQYLYIVGVKEVRGQVPGTTCNGARTKIAVNNPRVSQCLGLPRHRKPKYRGVSPMHRGTRRIYGASRWRHTIHVRGC